MSNGKSSPTGGGSKTKQINSKKTHEQETKAQDPKNQKLDAPSSPKK